jgi:hypothetical protein
MCSQVVRTNDPRREAYQKPRKFFKMTSAFPQLHSIRMTLKGHKDHTGRRIGTVTIVRRRSDPKLYITETGREYQRPLHWEAVCDCGTRWLVPHTQITDTTPATCKACAPKHRQVKKRFPKGQHHKRTHPSYGSWYSMHRRCSSPKHVNYHNYGGRGITVCPRWQSFDAFVEDMGVRPEGKTLDRVRNDEPYSPSNCRWATPAQQRANQRTKAQTARKP